jgi:hypothetical protein
LEGLINVLEFQNTDSTGSVIFVNKQRKTHANKNYVITDLKLELKEKNVGQI